MTGDDFVARLRRFDDSPEVLAMLADLKVSKKPKMSSGDIDARINKKGLSLVFEPEGPKTSRLVFTAVQFEEGYEGELPRGLSLTYTRTQVRAKLGLPTDVYDDYNMDLWKSDDLQLSVDYSDDDDVVTLVTVELPKQG